MTINFLPVRMAFRYLRAKNSYSAVSAISIIAVVGVAVATAAIVCVLSVFNGFRSILNDRLDTLAPDIMVTPALGKTFANGDSLALEIQKMPGIEAAMPSVTDNALLIAESREMPITLKGVTPEVYSTVTAIDSIMVVKGEGEALSTSNAAISVGVAKRLGIYSTDVPLLIFAPRREGRVNLANPLSSFLTDSLNVGGVFQAMQSEYDENTVICDIATARDLFQYDTQASAIEIKGTPGYNPLKLTQEIKTFLGEDYVVKDRAQQQALNFRMVQIEKWVTFLLLVFILVIASFNIISTLCMLIIDKEGSISTLSALGMKKRKIGSLFGWQSLFVSVGGGAVGIIIGLVVCLIQQHFGVIKLAGDPQSMVVNAYPVVVEWLDLLAAFVPVLIIGIITSWISSAFASSRLKSTVV